MKNDEWRMMNNEYSMHDGTTNVVSSNPEGLHVYSQPVSRRNSTPAGVAQPVVSYRFYKHLMPACSADRPPASGSRKTEGERVRNGEIVIENNNQYSMMNEETGNNIPVLRTSGYNAVTYSTNITGALHLGFQTTGTAISETAAAPQNILPNIRLICQTSISKTAAAPRNTLSDCRRICRTAGHPSGKKVQSTETLKENKEYRITNNESGRKIPVQGRLIPEGLHVYSQPVSRRNSTPAGVAQTVVSYRFYKHLMPPASGSRKTEGERVRNGEIVIENNNQYSKMNEETGNNIPVLRTLGYYAVSYSTKIDGALHLGFQHTGIAISETAAASRNTLSGIQWNCRTFNGETAAAPRNICRTAYRSSERKVQRTETLKGITAQVTAHDTRRLGNALGDKQTKTNSKKVKG